MADLLDDLDRVLAHLYRLARPAADRLQTPLSLAEIERWESTLPFRLTREIELVYGWHDGTRAEEGAILDDLQFFPGFFLLSLEEAVRTYEERKDAPQWRAGWFPLFADGAGDFYLVPCQRRKLASAPVIGFLHGEPEQVVEYESVAAMIQTLAAAYDEGVFFVDDDDTLEMDDDRYRPIAHRFNPGVREWRN